MKINYKTNDNSILLMVVQGQGRAIMSCKRWFTMLAVLMVEHATSIEDEARTKPTVFFTPSANY